MLINAIRQDIRYSTIVDDSDCLYDILNGVLSLTRYLFVHEMVRLYTYIDKYDQNAVTSLKDLVLLLNIQIQFKSVFFSQSLTIIEIMLQL